MDRATAYELRMGLQAGDDLRRTAIRVKAGG